MSACASRSTPEKVAGLSESASKEIRERFADLVLTAPQSGAEVDPQNLARGVSGKSKVTSRCRPATYRLTGWRRSLRYGPRGGYLSFVGPCHPTLALQPYRQRQRERIVYRRRLPDRPPDRSYTGELRIQPFARPPEWKVPAPCPTDPGEPAATHFGHRLSARA
jgi:hypothetical protein